MTPSNSSSLCSVIIPARNESENLTSTVSNLAGTLIQNQIPYEILIINDVEQDGDPKTAEVVSRLKEKYPTVILVNNQKENHGFGRAIQLGLNTFTGSCAAIVMADGSDDPKDLVSFYNKINEGYDCVFGSRFMKGGRIIDYPKNKLLVNRMANWFLAALFLVPYDDFTNAFKCYSRSTVKGILPLMAPHFSVTVEMPLKAIARGYKYAILPNGWYGKKSRVSNLRIARMASRYLYIALVVFLEKLLVRSDYAKR